ncbi:hypothetical protein GALMADRAFT_208249 [Galerina marginata CBS 339.88]|uniref:ELYS-like domain-containing protein n=1 Tax=Galerina marginata (strain CBS 339.88) TaxID=685588 RepID=A0A067TM53_GALM3|nr:hypothetical protein GALMADRAFT_208249 [Galerina marginata CBS 339.88]
MDVDADQPTRRSPFINFFDVSNNFPFQDPRPEHIRDRRASLDDTLIFDILLASGGIKSTNSLYPPETPQGLQELLDAIESSHYDRLKKDCLVYFLLKWHQDGRERHFQQQRCIPPQFAALADAYWHLDTGIDVPRAVAILSDARLNRDYSSKIIRAISLTPDKEALVRRYIQTAKPLLVEPEDIECYALALADSSILEAWQFSRTFNEQDPMRTRLFKEILGWSVTPKPRPAALKQLLVLPFSSFEESLLNTYVQKPPTTLEFSQVAILQDLICVRLIQGGRYSEAIKLDRQFTSITPPKHLKLTKDRSQMVQQVYTSLPSVERSLIELELDPTQPQPTPLVPKPATPQVHKPPAAQEPQDMSLSQSWEDVRMPATLVNNSTSTPLREVRVPAAALTFGGTPLHASTSIPSAPPILPVNFSAIASGSGSTPRKSLPLSSSVLGSAKPRLSGVGTRMAFGNGSVISSPASGMKLPPANPAQGHAFVSASQQQNAFYQPPPAKTNGVKRAFEEDTNRSPERANNASARTADDVEMETENEDTSFEKDKRDGKKKNGNAEQPDNDEDIALEYSVFAAKKKRAASQPSKRKVTPKIPPGSFAGSEDDDVMMDDDQEEEEKTRRTRTSRSTATRTSKAQTQTQTVSKPPAKKARQIKEKDLSRSIPGSLMMDDEEGEEEEEDDQVAPLRAPSPHPRRPVRKSRSAASVEMADESEGVQTRRRSTRLTVGGTGSAGGSANGGSPEPPLLKAKKATRASGARRKR